MNRGVLILAVRNSSYGKMAYNLAVSIKKANPDIKVQLICDEVAVSFLSESQLKTFDHLSELHGAYHECSVGELKTKLIELTAFHQTLFIDADSIMFPTADLSTLFDKLKGYHYRPFYRRNFDRTSRKEKLMYGFSLQDCMDEFGVEHTVPNFGTIGAKREDCIYEVNSHFMYFEKGLRMEAFFKVVNEVYQQLSRGEKLEGKVSDWKEGMVPDEAAFSIATYLCGMFPWEPTGEWTPIYDTWSDISPFSHIGANVAMIGKYGITLQGDPNPNTIQFYDYICTLLKIKYQVNDLFRWEQK